MYDKIIFFNEWKTNSNYLNVIIIVTEKTYHSKSATSSPYNTRRNMTTKQPKKVRNFLFYYQTI